jgi:CHAT domain-containing protein
MLPDAHVVRGSETSKQALLERWSRASIVYVAAHLERDADAPLFNYFPIAFGAASRTLEDDYLDLRDVRDSDLRRCRLVVLSSCASGEPYVAGTHSGPSMADAFLDAGAETVIHTRWRVRDESAAETAPQLAKAWLDGASHGATSWRAARTSKLRGPRGVRHPFEWAAWSLTTAVPVPAWEAGAAPVTSPSPAVALREKPAPNPARGE